MRIVDVPIDKIYVPAAKKKIFLRMACKSQFMSASVRTVMCYRKACIASKLWSYWARQ